jgi:hypothetical protein
MTKNRKGCWHFWHGPWDYQDAKANVTRNPAPFGRGGEMGSDPGFTAFLKWASKRNRVKEPKTLFGCSWSQVMR